MSSNILQINITPMGYVRRTRADAWRGRPVVLRYYAYKNELALHVRNFDFNKPFGVKFILPMPNSWSKKKKAEKLNTNHDQKPDLDNMVKALLDSAMSEDKTVADLEESKWWGEEGQIILYYKNPILLLD